MLRRKGLVWMSINEEISFKLSKVKNMIHQHWPIEVLPVKDSCQWKIPGFCINLSLNYNWVLDKVTQCRLQTSDLSLRPHLIHVYNPSILLPFCYDWLQGLPINSRDFSTFSRDCIVASALELALNPRGICFQWISDQISGLRLLGTGFCCW